MKFDFGSIVKYLSVAPVVIAGIEALHGEKDSATKQQMAHDALSLATGVSAAVLSPDNANTAQVVSASLSSVIDSIVGIFNATGVFSHKTPALPAPAPANTGVVPPAVVAVGEGLHTTVAQ